MRLGSQHAGKIWKQRFHSKINWLPSTCKIFAHFGFVWNKKTRAGKLHDHRDIVFEKLRFQNVFHPHSNAKPAFFYEQRFRKLQFREGLVRTVDLPVEKSCDFKFPFIVCRRSLIYLLATKNVCFTLLVLHFHMQSDLANQKNIVLFWWWSYGNFFRTLCMGIFACSSGLIFLWMGFHFTDSVFQSITDIVHYEDCHSWSRPQSSSVVW